MVHAPAQMAVSLVGAQQVVPAPPCCSIGAVASVAAHPQLQAGWTVAPHAPVAPQALALSAEELARWDSPQFRTLQLNKSIADGARSTVWHGMWQARPPRTRAHPPAHPPTFFCPALAIPLSRHDQCPGILV